MKKSCKGLLAALGCLLLLTARSIMVSAAPLEQIPVAITQPDGDEVVCCATGDEFFSYLTDEAGSVIIQNEDTGFYVYAALDNGQITTTDQIVSSDSSGGSGAGGASSRIGFEDIPESYIEGIRQQNSLLQKLPEEAAAASTEYNPSSNGYYNKTVQNLVIFIRFSNSSFSHRAVSTYEAVFNTGGKSMKDYYNEVSYGKTQIESQYCSEPDGSTIITYTAPHERSYYLSPGSNREKREYELITGALQWAVNNSHIPADTDLDANDDGYIDAVTFIASGNVDTSSNAIFWPHQWTIGALDYFLGQEDTQIDINGARLDRFSINMEGVLTGNTTGDPYQTYAASVCHETFHMVFGGPDLYYGTRTPRANANAVGRWDLMCSSNGGHMDAYLKYRYGQWIDMPEITEAGRYTLQPLTSEENNCYMIRSPYSAHEYFVLEYRKKGASGSFEYNIPASGLIIYRIDDRYWGNYDSGTIPYDGAPPDREEVYVYRENPSSYASNTDADTANLSSRSSVVLKFRKDANISVALPVSNGSNAGITIRNISAASDTISFDVDFTEKLRYGFRDIRVAEAVASACSKTPDALTQADYAGVDSLILPYLSWYELPYDLTGLDRCVSLDRFQAIAGGLRDISQLSGLTKLTSLTLTNNNIRDISPLKNLTALKTLCLRGNLIADYSPTQSYYSSLTRKDFSLTNQGDAEVYVASYHPDTTEASLTLRLSETVPDFIYLRYEAFDSDGALVQSEMDRINTSWIAGSSTHLRAPNGLSALNGGYLTITAYEREDCRQQMYRIIIRPQYFDLTTAN